MYLEHFIRARDHLSRHGLRPRIVLGTPVFEQDLADADALTDFPMPRELRQFYLELGEAFAFLPDDRRGSNLSGWQYMHLADHVIGNKGFREEIEEAALPFVNEPHVSVDSVMLRKEMERRFSWMPFWGFGSGGAYLCLDLNTNPPIVRAYTGCFWVTSPQTWDFVVAKSFTEFIEKWSPYHFIAPRVDWTSFFSFQEGTFDWSPKHFPRLDD